MLAHIYTIKDGNHFLLLETNSSCSTTTRLLVAGHMFLSDSQQTNGDSPNVLMKVETPWVKQKYITNISLYHGNPQASFLGVINNILGI